MNTDNRENSHTELPKHLFCIPDSLVMWYYYLTCSPHSMTTRQGSQQDEMLLE